MEDAEESSSSSTADLIVSLTSFPPRFSLLPRVIKSLTHQTLKPHKVILYLARDELKGEAVPRDLSELQSDQFEIVTVDNNFRPYNKLVHALRSYPDKSIVTVDDDIVYNRHLIRGLAHFAHLYPGHVIANRARIMVFDQESRLVSHNEWPIQSGVRGHGVLPRGTGGVLYPPRSLHEDVGRDDLFMKFCPTTDDIWFKVMTRLQGTKAVAITTGKDKILKARRHQALSATNKLGIVDENLRAALKYYDIDPVSFQDLSGIPWSQSKQFSKSIRRPFYSQYLSRHVKALKRLLEGPQPTVPA